MHIAPPNFKPNQSFGNVYNTSAISATCRSLLHTRIAPPDFNPKASHLHGAGCQAVPIGSAPSGHSGGESPASRGRQVDLRAAVDHLSGKAAVFPVQAQEALVKPWLITMRMDLVPFGGCYMETGEKANKSCIVYHLVLLRRPLHVSLRHDHVMQVLAAQCGRCNVKPLWRRWPLLHPGAVTRWSPKPRTVHNHHTTGCGPVHSIPRGRDTD